METFEHQRHRTALNAFWLGLEPDPLLTVDAWADSYRFLSDRESPEPGRWRTSRVPYLVEPLRCLSPMHPAKEVVLMFGAQLAKTEAGNNWIGHNIACAPGPMLAVQPTVDIGKRYSRQRLAPMIQATPTLRGKIKDSRSRDSGNTVLSKEFPGGLLMIAGANSAAGLRSMPIRYLFQDEIDAYPEDCDGEGDPCELAEARTRNFSRKKILSTSTPTFEGRSRIAAKFLEGNQQYCHVPCPHCGEHQLLVFANLKWDKGRPDTARYVCESCGTLIDEHQKTKMLAGHRWIPANPDASPETVSFHLNSLYSPVGWFSWAAIAKQWEKAQGNPNRLRTFVNTVLAETWKEKGEAPEWKKLYDRRETYAVNSISDPQVLFLTSGVDVQADRLEAEIVGWGKDKQSWSIDHRVIQGDTDDLSDAGPWHELAKLLEETWVHPGGVELAIVRMAVDEGYKTQTVRTWVRQYPPTRVMAVRGSDTTQALLGLPRAVDVNTDGKRIKRGLKHWNVGVGIAKSELYGWLQQEKPTSESGDGYPGGYCHFPEYGEEYFRQLTAEQIVVRLVRGYRRYTWEKTRDRNEALDLRIYARAAAAAFGLDRFKEARWKEMEEALAAVSKPDSTKDNGQIREVNGVKMRPGKYLKKRDR